MPLDEKARYTMRIDRDLLEKFGYIAEYEGRTKNRELEQMITVSYTHLRAHET